MDYEAKSALQTKVQQLCNELDGPVYAKQVSWESFVVLAYRYAEDREPTPLEFYLLSELRNHHGMTRSEVLALVLRGEKEHLDWEDCALLLGKRGTADFVPSEEEIVIAQALTTTPVSVIIEQAEAHRRNKWTPPRTLPPSSKQVPGTTYNTYFGFMHAHSHLSLDANGAPEEAYRYAHEEGGLDFFALTDHAIFLDIWPWDNKWERLRAAADEADIPGEFAALWGFEWSNPVLGHVSVINTPDFTDTLATFGLEDFYDWLGAYPEGFGRFNHPGDFDFIGTEFKHFMRYAPAVSQMTGLEIWNGKNGFDRYHYSGGWDGTPTFLDNANLHGWQVGALGAEDNHHGQWGTLTEFRTAVLAETLERESIIEAYRARRFYATEDKDLYLDFRCQGYPMGSRLTDEAREFTISMSDGSGDIFIEARLYRNGEEIASAELSENETEISFADHASIGPDYYYVMVTQADDNDNNSRGDEAVSSPIWFGEVPPQGLGCAAGNQTTSVLGSFMTLLFLGMILLFHKGAAKPI